MHDIEVRAHAAWEAGRLDEAFQLFQQGATAGAVGCELMLGYFHDEGIGTVRDKAQAMRWYKRAYRRGDAAAASNIAMLYRERLNYRLMFQWLQRAFALGDAEAALELAQLYALGHGVRRSPSDAARMLQAALASANLSEESREHAHDLADAWGLSGEASAD